MTKIYFKTHGCSTNASETEVMAGILEKAQFEIVKDPKEANVIIINICTVKGEETAIRSIRKTIEEFPKKRYIIAGCLTQELISQIGELSEDVSIINTHNIKNIAEVVEETIHDNPISALSGYTKEEKICLPRERLNKVVGIVPILSGCDNECSYCSVRLIKGKLVSYKKEHILEEVKKALSEGCKEIWITSQDNASYGLDRGKNLLPELLKEILAINKEFMLRLGMMNPNNVKPILDDLINIYKENKKIFKFLHLPVQSGNNDILKLMNRNYEVEDWKEIINKFRANIPNITIATDIIVGFPTETEQQFNDSLNLIKEIKPDVLNRSRFQARPNTKAKELEQLPGGTIKDRSGMITDIFLNISKMNNEKWLDWVGTVLIDEEGKENTMVGRNFAYKPIGINKILELGTIVKVKVSGTTTHSLRAECLE